MNLHHSKQAQMFMIRSMTKHGYQFLWTGLQEEEAKQCNMFRDVSFAHTVVEFGHTVLRAVGMLEEFSLHRASLMECHHGLDVIQAAARVLPLPVLASHPPSGVSQIPVGDSTQHHMQWIQFELTHRCGLALWRIGSLQQEIVEVLEQSLTLLPPAPSPDSSGGSSSVPVDPVAHYRYDVLSTIWTVAVQRPGAKYVRSLFVDEEWDARTEGSTAQILPPTSGETAVRLLQQDRDTLAPRGDPSDPLEWRKSLPCAQSAWSRILAIIPSLRDIHRLLDAIRLVSPPSLSPHWHAVWYSFCFHGVVSCTWCTKSIIINQRLWLA